MIFIVTFRTKSHDPASSRHSRYSIQVNENDPDFFQSDKRTKSVRKIRNTINKTLWNPSQFARAKYAQFFKSDKDMLSYQPNELVNKTRQGYTNEFVTTANFGSRNRISDYKNSIVEKSDSKLWSPARMSFVSDEVQDSLRYTFFPKEQPNESKMSFAQISNHSKVLSSPERLNDPYRKNLDYKRSLNQSKHHGYTINA